jgi:hypothetical protein
MKKFNCLHKLLGFAAIAVALCTTSACTQGGGAPSLISSDDEAAATEEQDGQINEALANEAGEERLIYRIGPVDLPAYTEADVDDALVLNFKLSRPMWVIGFEPLMVDANGEEVDGQLLHSAIVSNLHEENPLCTSANVGNPFVIATSTLTSVKFPNGYGYPVLATDPLEARVVVRNPTETSYLNVYFEITLVAKEMNEFVKMKDIKPMLLDVDACNHKPLSVEPNNISRSQATYMLQDPYKLIVANGALQSYGICVELTANKEVLPFWTAEAVVGDHNHILDLRNDPFADPAGVPFKRGDSVTLSVVYDNTSNGWIDDATAAAMAYFTPEEE